MTLYAELLSAQFLKKKQYHKKESTIRIDSSNKELQRRRYSFAEEMSQRNSSVFMKERRETRAKSFNEAYFQPMLENLKEETSQWQHKLRSYSVQMKEVLTETLNRREEANVSSSISIHKEETITTTEEEVTTTEQVTTTEEVATTTATKVSSLHILQLAEDAEWDHVLHILEKCPSLSSNIDIFQMTCLHWACTDASIEFEIFKRILTYNPQLCNHCNASGMYPLHIALTYQLPDLHIILLAESTDISVMWTKDSEGNLPIQIAQQSNRPKPICDLLSVRKRHSSVKDYPSHPNLSPRASTLSLPSSDYSSAPSSRPPSDHVLNKLDFDVETILEINKNVSTLLNEIKGLRESILIRDGKQPQKSKPPPISLATSTTTIYPFPQSSIVVQIRWDTRYRLGISFEPAFTHCLSPKKRALRASQELTVLTGARIKRFTDAGCDASIENRLLVGDILCRINRKNVKNCSFHKIISYLEHLRSENHKKKECLLEFVTMNRTIKREEQMSPISEVEIESEDHVTCSSSPSSGSSTSLSSSLFDEDEASKKLPLDMEELRSVLPTVKGYTVRSRGEAATFNGYASFGSSRYMDDLSCLYDRIHESKSFSMNERNSSRRRP